MRKAVDISKWQDNNATPQKVDFAKMKAAGVELVIIRAAYGTEIDEDFRDYWRDAKAAGIPRAAYFFLKWWAGSPSPATQIAFWLSLILEDPGEYQPEIDMERPDSSWPEMPGHDFLVDAIWQFHRAIKATFPRFPRSTLYTNPACIHERLKPVPQWMLDQVDLHIAHYYQQAADIEPWTKWVIWQWGLGKGQGPTYGVESLDIDLDWLSDEFAGTTPQEDKPMPVTGLTLGAWISPDRTPFVDFDELKKNGVKFVVAWMGAGKTGDPLVDSKPYKINGVDWFAHVVDECYRVDIPCFAQFEVYPEHGTDMSVPYQVQPADYLIHNKKVGGLFGSIRMYDLTGKLVDPVWNSDRLENWVNQMQKKNPAFWVGPIGMSTFHVSQFAATWERLETWIGKNGVPQNTGPALCWIENVTAAKTLAWKDLPAAYPSIMPTLLPNEPGKQTAAHWYIWAWSLNYKLPGFYIDADKTQLGNPWLCFFNGDEMALNGFAFYQSHGYTPPNGGNEPPPSGDDDGTGDDQQDGGTVSSADAKAICDRLDTIIAQNNTLLKWLPTGINITGTWTK